MPTNRTFIDPVPGNWDPTDQLPHWLAISPNFTLPGIHAHYSKPVRQDWKVSNMLQRGVSHWSPRDLEFEGVSEASFRAAHPHNEYNDVPRIREIFGLTQAGPDNWVAGGWNTAWWPNGPYTEAQARAKGQSVSIAPHLWIGETMEGEDYMPEGNAMWKPFYEELMARMITRNLSDNKPFMVCHNYFTRFGSTNNLYQMGKALQSSQQAMYSSDPATWPATDYHPGGSLANTNLVMFDLYINEPDSLPRRVYQALFHMELMAKMYKLAGLCWFDTYEWHPGFAYFINMPEGVFERSDKAPFDPSFQMLVPVLAHEYGVVSVQWGLHAGSSTDKHRVLHPTETGQPNTGKDRWYPIGNESNPQTYPAYVYNDYYQIPGGYLNDLPHFGLRAWYATGGQTQGGTNYYCRFRIDGGAWVDPVANGSDVVRAYYEQKWLVRARILGDKMSVFAFSLFADNESHTLEYQHPTNPSLTYQATVCGGKPHLDLIQVVDIT